MKPTGGDVRARFWQGPGGGEEVWRPSAETAR